MGKKRQSTGNVSKGERRSSIGYGSQGVTNADKMLRKLDALAKGKDITITLENPNKEETNRRFIKYKVSGKAYVKYIQGGSEKKGARNPLLSLGE